MLTALIQKNIGSFHCLESFSISCNFTYGSREIIAKLVFNSLKEYQYHPQEDIKVEKHWLGDQ